MCVLKAEREQEPADTSEGPAACPGGANIRMRIPDHANRPGEDSVGSFKCAEGDTSYCDQSAGTSLRVMWICGVRSPVMTSLDDIIRIMTHPL